MDTLKKTTTRRFVVRRQARWPGHVQEERWGRPWRPVGTLARDVLLRYPATQSGKTPRVDPHQSPKDAAPLLHAFFDRVTSRASSPHVEWSRWTVPWAIPSALPQGDGREMVLEFHLDLNTRLHAVWLSLAFGLVSRRLWKCWKCRQPFIRGLQQLQLQTCDQCEHDRTVKTAAGLRRSLRKPWQQHRRDLSVLQARGKISKETRERLQYRALAHLRQVSRNLDTLEAQQARGADVQARREAVTQWRKDEMATVREELRAQTEDEGRKPSQREVA